MEQKSRISTKFMVLAGVFAAVTGILSQISIPLPSGVPVTMQTFAVALTAYVLGAKLGTAAIGIYLLLGAMGLPVFAGFGGGLGVLVGMTGGFLWGFLWLALCCGYATSLKHSAAAWALSLAGLAGCHLLGVSQFMAVTGRGLSESFLMVSLPYLAKDGISMALAWKASRVLRRGMHAARILPQKN